VKPPGRCVGDWLVQLKGGGTTGVESRKTFCGGRREGEKKAGGKRGGNAAQIQCCYCLMGSNSQRFTRYSGDQGLRKGRTGGKVCGGGPGGGEKGSQS